MRTDPIAAARADMRSRTRVQPVRPPRSREEYAELNAQQARLNMCTGGCATCCAVSHLVGDGSVLRCALLEGDYNLTPEETEIAQNCKMPRTYAEVWAGHKKDLRLSDTLKIIPFNVPPETIEFAEVEEAYQDAKANKVTEAGRKLLTKHGLWGMVEQEMDQLMNVKRQLVRVDHRQHVDPEAAPVAPGPPTAPRAAPAAPPAPPAKDAAKDAPKDAKG